MCALFVGGGSTSATSVLLRRRYPLTVRGSLFTLRVGGLFVATLENQGARYPQSATRSVAFSSASSEPSH